MNKRKLTFFQTMLCVLMLGIGNLHAQGREFEIFGSNCALIEGYYLDGIYTLNSGFDDFDAPVDLLSTENEYYDVYVSSDGTYEMQHLSSEEGGWGIFDYDGILYYSNPTDSEFPPTEGWIPTENAECSSEVNVTPVSSTYEVAGSNCAPIEDYPLDGIYTLKSDFGGGEPEPIALLGTENEDYYDLPIYVSENSPYEMRPERGVWGIFDYDGILYYSNPTDSEFPPTEGWIPTENAECSSEVNVTPIFPFIPSEITISGTNCDIGGVPVDGTYFLLEEAPIGDVFYLSESEVSALFFNGEYWVIESEDGLLYEYTQSNSSDVLPSVGSEGWEVAFESLCADAGLPTITYDTGGEEPDVTLEVSVSGSDAITLTWTVGTPENATSFEIWRSQDASASAGDLVNGEILTSSQIPVPAPGQATYIFKDTGLDAGTTYYYSVRYNEAGAE